ncbi:aromatic ring-hydroxylating oxygenase subunit alpha [Actinacidiphila acidipaludis]|uniref:aromatic ring-hydroxylating oxygenase subunit alpha n=1 Tax=Actinacidiphila acidipaludis TaxID=2873382 RepID=UPI00223B4021|nr:aromatic ring-hydroxylating dioxygenase subunit alpha [Streptomyces acidipaludis]
MIESALAEDEGRTPLPADLRRVGIDPDFWYPVVPSRTVPEGKVVAASFAGRRIAVFRAASGTVSALEDRCAHRQVPLSMGVVEGESLRCCYHAWAYRGDGRISQIPYLSKETGRPPRSVRAYPTREAAGLVFVFPGDPARAATTPMPDLALAHSATHKVMRYSRTVRCHYTFMHENLLDMNHQFLHRGVLGKIQPELLGYESGPGFVQARYRFTSGGGRKDRGAGLLSAEGLGGGGGAPDVLTIRTGYPYQTLELLPDGATEPAFSLWAAYVPVDAAQRVCHVHGMLMIRKPRFTAALNLAWPVIRRFTERVFAEDRMAVEAEQRAWDEQGEDQNREIFPLILDLREVLRNNGVALGQTASVCEGAAACGVATPS